MSTPNLRLPLGGDFALNRIGQISVNVHDLERAVRFYQEVLRLPFLFRAEKLAFFDAGGVRLMLDVPEQPEFNHPSSILYFSVPSIRTGYQALAERGVHFEGPPRRIARLEQSELWMAFFRDPEGNVLALMSEEAVPTPSA